MKRILMSLFVVFSYIVPAVSQVNGITISGFIHPSFIEFYNCKELFMKVYDPINKLSNSEELLKTPIHQDGSFKIEIPFSSKFQYVSFWVLNNGNKGQPGELLPIDFRQTGSGYLNAAYFFEAGDAIKIGIEENGQMSFSGSGGSKLSCQYKVNSLEFRSLERRINELLLEHEYDKAFDLQMDILDLIIKMRINVLASYKDKFTEEVYRKIYLDAVVNAKTSALNLFLQKKSAARSKDEKFMVSFSRHFEKWLNLDRLIPIDSSLGLLSKNYGTYLFDREIGAYKIAIGDKVNDDPFIYIYNTIRSKYSGKMRDQLLLICFDRLSLNFKGNITPFIKDAVNIASDEKMSDLFALIEKKQPGSKAFPFELEGVDGKIHRLSDYKGKVLVIDFWFTGCFWCTRLNAAMHPIINKYRNNKDVVFLSVCEDQKKETWLKSLKSEIYTSPESINLYTNGYGVEHPFMRFYNFSGAPQQLIISKEGYLVTASPPRPDACLPSPYDKNNVLDLDDMLKCANVRRFLEILDLQLSKNNSK